MMDVGRHPNIELLTLSEVEEITGFVGNFHAKVRKRARYVDASTCTACGDCVDVCPVTYPDEFQGGLGTRRAIFIPFPQAVPAAYLINPEECLGHNPIACGKCQEACDPDCIDFDMADEIVELDIGVVIVATGLDVFDPTGLTEYGYTRYENVITSLEFERLISAGGPTEGHFVRPTDMQRPRSIGFIQCVGSRTLPPPGGNGASATGALGLVGSGEGTGASAAGRGSSGNGSQGGNGKADSRDLRNTRGHPYCSNICCMNTVKDSLLLRDHYPDIDISVYYMDIRAFGKGFEELYRRSKEAGVKYIRGLPGMIDEDPETQNLIVTVENTMTGELETHEHDMIVLSLGLIPPADQDRVKGLLTLSTTEDGFFLERHPKLQPVDAPTEGVFLAGCAEGPKDVKDSVTQAGAAAARAQIVLSKPTIQLEPIIATVDPDICNACGRCVGVCPFNAIIGGDAKAKIKAEVIEAMCHGCGTCVPECNFTAIDVGYFTDQEIVAELDAALAHDPEELVLVFACNWCSYAGSDFAGVSRLQQPTHFRTIRTMCSGRVDPDYVLRAFRKGVAVVLVSGCHFGDCHYLDANHETARRIKRLQKSLERKGIRPERLRLEWISAAEGQKWARVMHELEELRQTVTREEIEETKRILAPKKKARQPA
jgi:heterodisulfide reductase subunit A